MLISLLWHCFQAINDKMVLGEIFGDFDGNKLNAFYFDM